MQAPMSLIKHLQRLKKERRYRQACQSVLVEGSKMVMEAKERFGVRAVIATNNELFPDAFVVSPVVMKGISSQKNPEGIVAEVPMPPAAVLGNERYIVALDAIQDPGNVGTLIRTALALGWEAVVLLGASADPFGHKALSAAKGASFRMPVVTMKTRDLKKYCEEKGLSFVAADLEGAKPGRIEGGCCLVLGNEGKGLSRDVSALISKKVAIDMKGDMESLNVAAAGAILLYVLR